MSISEQISPLVGRWAIAWFFLSAAWYLANNWHATISGMTHDGLPVAPLLLAFALLVMLFGSLSLILGYHTRHGALVLFAFTIVTTALMHAYWKLPTPAERFADYELFARNIAIAGGLLLLVGMGPGPFAIDNRAEKGG